MDRRPASLRADRPLPLKLPNPKLYAFTKPQSRVEINPIFLPCPRTLVHGPFRKRLLLPLRNHAKRYTDPTAGHRLKSTNRWLAPEHCTKCVRRTPRNP